MLIAWKHNLVRLEQTEAERSSYFVAFLSWYLNFHANRRYLKNLKRQTPSIEWTYP